MPTIFVTIGLFLVIFLPNGLLADQVECLNITKQTICYDIEGTEDVVELDLDNSLSDQSMLISKDLADDNLMLVSSDLIKMKQDVFEPSIYEDFKKADELYYRFAYKILDRNNRDTTVVITRD